MADETLKPLLSSNSSSTLKSECSSSATSAPSTSTTRSSSVATAAAETAAATASDTARQSLPERLRVGIIGTGNYAMALTKRLTLLAGCDVILGSRKPELRRVGLSATQHCLCGVELASVSDCIKTCDILIVAIHKEDFRIALTDFAHLTAGKVVVDVSNREYRYAAQSNAEYLASILPGAAVVKAFNSISAVAMEDVGDSSYSSESRVVYVAGDDPGAREKVMTLAQAMGFRAVNLGLLTSARWMEDFVLKVFTHWKIPIFLAFGIFNLCTLYIVYLYFIEKPTPVFKWEQIFLKVLNKPLCMTAITMLALTYLPGQLASVLQVYNGTKHRRFPQFLDTWLKSRKQFGLVSFFLVTLHAIASVLMLSPTYYSSWFHKVTVTLPANLTSATSSDLVLTPSKAWMTWKGEAACAVGILAFVLMAAVALTSIRSVGESLNWSEWRCVHSQISYGVLALSAAHVCVMGGPGWAKNGFPKTFKSITFLSVLLPLAVLALKLAFSVPPLSGYLRKIRRGWERDGAGVEGGKGDPALNRSSLTGGGCCGSNNGNFKLSSGAGKELNRSGVSIVITDEMDSGKSAADDKQRGGDSNSGCSCSDKNGDLYKNKTVLLPASSSSSISSPSQSHLSSQSSQTSHARSQGNSVAIVHIEPRNEHAYGGVSLHKDCTCAEQDTLHTSLPQCQCSSV